MSLPTTDAKSYTTAAAKLHYNSPCDTMTAGLICAGALAVCSWLYSGIAKAREIIKMVLHDEIFDQPDIFISSVSGLPSLFVPDQTRLALLKSRKTK